MAEEPLLLIPGPTNLSERVRSVMAEPQRSHVGREFYTDFKEILELSRYVFANAKGVQFVFSGSGTVGMESAVVSTVGHGDRVLVVETGYFGKRMTMLNQVHGAKTDVLSYPEGKHADPDDLRKKLHDERYTAVYLTHVETSAGTRNSMKELVAEVNSAGAFSIVDSVCGVGGERLEFDALGADIAFTASQKALAGAPGAVLIAASGRIMEHFERRRDSIESYYMNLLRWKPLMDDPKIYLATPSVQVLLALRQALIDVKAEGMEARWDRHRRLGDMVRDRLQGLGLDIVADDGYRANTITAFWVKDGLAGKIQRSLELTHRVVVARGVADDKDRMIRIGHFGILRPEMLEGPLEALAEVLRSEGAVGASPIQLSSNPKSSE